MPTVLPIHLMCPIYFLNDGYASSNAAGPDPGTNAFFTPGSGMGKKPRFGSGNRIRVKHPGSYFEELKNNFLDKKYLNTVMWIRIRNPDCVTLDPGWKNSDPG
jgi:hypothetical protein